MIAKMIAPKMIAPGAKKTKTEMIVKMIAGRQNSEDASNPFWVVF